MDDGSRDRTVEHAKDSFPAAPWLRVIKLRHKGKGHTVKEGMLLGRGDLLLFTDADLSTPMKELPSFLKAIEGGADVVIASRDLASSKLVVPQAIHRRLVGKLFRLFIQWIFQLPHPDTQCGYKLFTRRAAKDIFRRTRISGFTFDVEVLYWAKLLGYKTVDLPVHWTNRFPSRVSMVRDLIPIIRELIGLRIQFRKKRRTAR